MAYGIQITNPDGALVIDDRYKNYSFIEKRTVSLDTAGIGSFLVGGYTDISAGAPKPRVFVKLKSGESAYVREINRAEGVATGFSWNNEQISSNETDIVGRSIATAFYGTLTGTPFIISTTAGFNTLQDNLTQGSYDMILGEFRPGCFQGIGEVAFGYYRGGTVAATCSVKSGFDQSLADRYGNVNVDFTDGFPSDDVEGGYTLNTEDTFVNHRSPPGASSSITVTSGGAGWTVGDEIYINTPTNVSPYSYIVTPQTGLGTGNFNNNNPVSSITLTCTGVGQGWQVNVGGTPSTDIECYVFAPTPGPVGSLGSDYGMQINNSNGDIAFSTDYPQLVLSDVLGVSATWARGPDAYTLPVNASAHDAADYTSFVWTIPTNSNARNIPSGKLAADNSVVSYGAWYAGSRIQVGNIGGRPIFIFTIIFGASGLRVNADNTQLTCVTERVTVAGQSVGSPADAGALYPYWDVDGTRYDGARPFEPANLAMATGTDNHDFSIGVIAQVPVIDTTVIDNVLGF